MSVVVDSRNMIATSHPELRCVCGHGHLDDLGPCRRPGIHGLTEQEAFLSQQVEPGRLYRCRHCFLGLRLPRPEQAKLESLYSAISADRWATDSSLSSAQKTVVRQTQLMANSASISVLDVGAFDGRFLDALPSRFQKCAIEPSAGGQAELAKKSIRVLKPFLEPANSEEQQQFDLVTMFDVFEHLTNPLEGVRSLMSYVKPGGRLVIGTADLDHWSWSATRGFHWYLDPIQHISVGSRKHFEWLRSQLPTCGLTMASVSHQSGNILSRIVEASQMIYFGVRLRSGLARIATRVMHLLPYFQRLSHKDAVPYTQKLQDHVVAVFTRPESDR